MDAYTDGAGISSMLAHNAAFTRADMVELIGAQLSVDAPGDPRQVIEGIVESVGVRISTLNGPRARGVNSGGAESIAGAPHGRHIGNLQILIESATCVPALCGVTIAGARRRSMSFLKLLVAFAPWIAFLIIARDTLLRVEIGLVVALALGVLIWLLRLDRGSIMWVGLLFFTAATVAVLGFHNLWTVMHLGVLANGALAVGAWATLLIGKPFTLDYARQNTDPVLWNNPVFIRTNVRITVAWAAVFTLNTALAWIRMEQVLLPQWACRTLSYAALVGAAAFTSWYARHVRRARLRGPDESAKPSPAA